MEKGCFQKTVMVEMVKETYCPNCQGKLAIFRQEIFFCQNCQKTFQWKRRWEGREDFFLEIESLSCL